MRSFAALLLTAVSLVSAALVVTNPTAATQYSATLASIVSWEDDSTSPSLAQIGAAKIQICSGSPTNQTVLQTLTSSINVSTNSSLVFRPTPSIGPTGRFYFIKITSLSLKTSNDEPYAAYSAYFTLVGMTGAWDDGIEGAAQSAAGDASSTAALPTTQSGATTISAATTSHTTGTASVTGSSSSSSATNALSTSTALPMVHRGVVLSASIVAVLVTVGSVCLGALALGL